MSNLQHYEDKCPKEIKKVVCEMNCYSCEYCRDWVDNSRKGKLTRFTQCSFVENRNEERRNDESKSDNKSNRN